MANASVWIHFIISPWIDHKVDGKEMFNQTERLGGRSLELNGIQTNYTFSSAKVHHQGAKRTNFRVWVGSNIY